MEHVNPIVHVIDDDMPTRDALHRLLSGFGFEVREYPSAGEYLLSWPPDVPGCRARRRVGALARWRVGATAPRQENRRPAPKDMRVRTN